MYDIVSILCGWALNFSGFHKWGDYEKTHLSDVQILPCVLLRVSPSFLSFLYLKGGREGRGGGREGIFFWF